MSADPRPAARPALSLVQPDPAAPEAEPVAATQPDPDAALLVAVGARDPAAVRTLVARKLPRLLALATRLLGDRAEAEDVAQEVFLRTWKQAPHWQAGAARVDTWLHRVALNLCYDRLRGRRETPMTALSGLSAASDAGGLEATDHYDPLHPGADTDDTPASRYESNARAAQVRAALAQLPPRQREAMVLHYYQELSNVDAAALMGIGVEALESLLARARRALRGSLGAISATPVSVPRVVTMPGSASVDAAVPTAAPQPSSHAAPTLPSHQPASRSSEDT